MQALLQGVQTATQASTDALSAELGTMRQEVTELGSLRADVLTTEVRLGLLISLLMLQAPHNALGHSTCKICNPV